MMGYGEKKIERYIFLPFRYIIILFLFTVLSKDNLKQIKPISSLWTRLLIEKSGFYDLKLC